MRVHSTRGLSSRRRPGKELRGWGGAGGKIRSMLLLFGILFFGWMRMKINHEANSRIVTDLSSPPLPFSHALRVSSLLCMLYYRGNFWMRNMRVAYARRARLHRTCALTAAGFVNASSQILTLQLHLAPGSLFVLLVSVCKAPARQDAAPRARAGAS